MHRAHEFIVFMCLHFSKSDLWLCLAIVHIAHVIANSRAVPPHKSIQSGASNQKRPSELMLATLLVTTRLVLSAPWCSNPWLKGLMGRYGSWPIHPSKSDPSTKRTSKPAKALSAHMLPWTSCRASHENFLFVKEPDSGGVTNVALARWESSYVHVARVHSFMQVASCSALMQ